MVQSSENCKLDVGSLNKKIEILRNADRDSDAISCNAPQGMVLNPTVESFMNIRVDGEGALLQRSILGTKNDLVEVYHKRKLLLRKRPVIETAQRLSKRRSLLQSVNAFNDVLTIVRTNTIKR